MSHVIFSSPYPRHLHIIGRNDYSWFMKKLLILSVSTLVGWCTLSVSAQTFYRTYGQPGRSEFGTTLLNASDGSIYLGGSVNDSALVQRLDANGNVLWSRSFKPSGQFPKMVMDLQEAPGGAIIGCGLGIRVPRRTVHEERWD